MAGAIAVVRAFGTQKEAIKSSVLPHCGQLLAPSGQDLVDVSLMTDIKEDLVGRRLKDTVEGDGEFNHSQVRPQMTTCFGQRSDQGIPDLLGKGGKIRLVNFTQISGSIDPVQQIERAHCWVKGSSPTSPRPVRVMISILCSAAASFSRQIFRSFMPSSYRSISDSRGGGFLSISSTISSSRASADSMESAGGISFLEERVVMIFPYLRTQRSLSAYRMHSPSMGSGVKLFRMKSLRLTVLMMSWLQSLLGPLINSRKF